MKEEKMFRKLSQHVLFKTLFIVFLVSCSPDETASGTSVEPEVTTESADVGEEPTIEQVDEPFPIEPVMEHYASYLEDLSTFEVTRESFPPDGSEGAVRITYLNTDIIRVQEIEQYISFGIRTFRLLADSGQPEVMVVTRVQWNPITFPHELIEDFREQGIFLRVTPESDWIVVNNELGFPVDRLENTRTRFDEELE